MAGGCCRKIMSRNSILAFTVGFFFCATFVMVSKLPLQNSVAAPHEVGLDFDNSEHHIQPRKAVPILAETEKEPEVLYEHNDHELKADKEPELPYEDNGDKLKADKEREFLYEDNEREHHMLKESELLYEENEREIKTDKESELMNEQVEQHLEKVNAAGNIRGKRGVGEPFIKPDGSNKVNMEVKEKRDKNNDPPISDNDMRHKIQGVKPEVKKRGHSQEAVLENELIVGNDSPPKTTAKLVSPGVRHIIANGAKPRAPDLRADKEKERLRVEDKMRKVALNVNADRLNKTYHKNVLKNNSEHLKMNFPHDKKLDQNKSNAKKDTKQQSERDTSKVQISINMNKEQHNVVFLKVHKAASTTVQNIILRFGMAKDLDVMLPKTGNLIGETGTKIRQERLFPYPASMKYNIVCNHLIFDKGQISRYLKYPGETRYIGILREPYSQFVSSFYFYLNTYKRKALVDIAMENPRNPVHRFLENPLKTAEVPNYAMTVSYINNRMSADFGFPMWNLETTKHNEKLIKKFLKQIESNFHLIMILEKFDESLVLLRRLLNWEVEDILYMKSNTRASLEEDHISLPWNTSYTMTDEDLKLHRLYAPVDHALYDKFSAMMNDKLRLQPPEFFEEVKMLKRLQADVSKYCDNVENVDKVGAEKGVNDDSESGFFVSQNKWTKQFIVTPRDCKLMTMSEMDLIDHAKALQKQRDKTIPKKG